MTAAASPCIPRPKRLSAFRSSTATVTGGGISSGLDGALKLVELLAGYEVAQEVQRTTPYYPAPPVASSLPQTGTCPFTW